MLSNDSLWDGKRIEGKVGSPLSFEVSSRRDIANIEKQSLIVSRFALVRDDASDRGVFLRFFFFL